MFTNAGLVMPSGIVSNATVTGNVRWGSAETDLSGADVVFGNKSFGDDKTENNLVVGGQLNAKNAVLGDSYNGGEVHLCGRIYFENGYLQGGKYQSYVYPTEKPMPSRFSVSGNWTVPRGWYTFSNGSDDYRYATNSSGSNLSGPSDGNMKIITAGAATLYYKRF
jgi:hypothetical protein